jgi:predicted amidohydrolase YtcJ
MVAVMQPLVARAARDAPGLFPARQRSDLAPHRPLIRAGVHVAFSSDLPVSTDPNPWPGIRAAIEDQVNGIGLAAALRGYTQAGAYVSFEEEVKGTLDPGTLADLQVYERDPLKEPLERWDGLRPQAVLLGGVRVFGVL